jgi:hypothetical protein
MSGKIQSVLKQVYDVINIFSTYGTLTVDGLDEEDEYVVHINKYQKELYCIELSGTSNMLSSLSNRVIDNIFKDYKNKPNAHIFQALYKNDKRQRHYIFSNNRRILELIQKDLDVRFLKWNEIIEVFNDFGMNQVWSYANKKESREHSVLKNKSLKFETLSSSVNSIIKDNFYKNISDKVDVYQSYSFHDVPKKIDYSKIFKEKWHGVIFIYTDFSSSQVLANLEKLKNQASLEGVNKKEFIELIEQYNSSNIELAVRNITFVLKESIPSTISSIANELNCDVKKKKVFLRRLLKYTPLVKRDNYGDKIVEKHTSLHDSISTCHKRETKNPDFTGKGLSGEFFDFNFAQTTVDKRNKNSSSVVIGVTGSGKTTSTNGIKARMLGCDLNRLFEVDSEKKYRFKEVVTQLDENYLREFDIKYSGYQLVRYLKKFENKDVKLINAEINAYRYNPFNINLILNNGKFQLDYSELSMNILLLSIALECKDERMSIALSEERILREVVESLYKNGFSTNYIATLEEVSPRIYEKLIACGYNRKQKISEVKEKEFAFLKAPILENIITEVTIYAGRTNDEVDKKEAESLRRKLRDIDSLQIFSSYDNDSVEFAKYLYIDLDKIKKNDEFIPVFLSIFNKMFTEDKKRQRALQKAGVERPYITYMFEEAFNLFSKPSFEKYLQIFMNEARSDKLRAVFVVQLINQVPSYIYKQIENKFLLFPSANKRESLVDEISEVLKPNEETKRFMLETPEFGIFLWNEHTSSVFTLGADKKEIEAFGQE